MNTTSFSVTQLLVQHNAVTLPGEPGPRPGSAMLRHRVPMPRPQKHWLWPEHEILWHTQQ